MLGHMDTLMGCPSWAAFIKHVGGQESIVPAARPFTSLLTAERQSWAQAPAAAASAARTAITGSQSSTPPSGQRRQQPGLPTRSKTGTKVQAGVSRLPSGQEEGPNRKPKRPVDGDGQGEQRPRKRLKHEKIEPTTRIGNGQKSSIKPEEQTHTK